MPVKRRLAKRRVDPTVEAAAWGSLFDAGHDFFGDLPSIGVATDDYGRVESPVAEEAWRRLGDLFLGQRHPDPREPWALITFGEPQCR